MFTYLSQALSLYLVTLNAVHVAVSAVAAACRVAGEGGSVAGRCFARCGMPGVLPRYIVFNAAQWL